MVIGGVFGLFFMVAYLFFIFTVSFNADKFVPGVVDNFRDTVFNVASSVGVVYLPSLWIADFFNSGSLVSFLLFALVSVGAPAAIVAIISRFNDRINALVSEDKVQKKFTTKQISTKSATPFVRPDQKRDSDHHGLSSSLYKHALWLLADGYSRLYFSVL